MPTWLKKKNFKKSTEMNYSQCKRAMLTLLGPTARVWEIENPEKPELAIQVGHDNYPGRNIYGAGRTFKEAYEAAVAKKQEYDSKKPS